MVSVVLQVQCIRISRRFNPWERVAHFGGFEDGVWWITMRGDALAGPEPDLLWLVIIVYLDGRVIWVAVPVGLIDVKHLTTTMDSEPQDNLPPLPERS